MNQFGLEECYHDALLVPDSERDSGKPMLEQRGQCETCGKWMTTADFMRAQAKKAWQEHEARS